MASKSALKSIKALLDQQQYQKAADEAQQLVKQDSNNHTALLFLAVAQENLEEFENAEKALTSASKLKPLDAQAYKGLIKLYEKQGHSQLDQYHNVVQILAQIYADHDDRDQCQSVVDKYELFAKKYGSQAQYRHALELLLPSSSLYTTLEGRVLQPALVYQRLLESASEEEKEWINSQIGVRRGRIGTTLDQITRDVKREAITKFNIEGRYTSLIDWIQDDSLRHDLEQQRFQRAFDNLLLLPSGQKSVQRDAVLNMANGMVIIKQEYAPAWRVALEWVDAENLQDWDPSIFRQYVGYFPDDGLSKVLRGFLDGGASPFPREEISAVTSEDGSAEIQLSEADQLILMNEGLDDCADSLLAHRIMAQTYMHLEEYESSVTAARRSQSLHVEAEKSYEVSLENSIDGVNLVLANALIHYQAPRHHAEAKSLFQTILSRKPKLTAALLGVGLIFEEDEDWSQAVKFMSQAADRDLENTKIRLELAWCQAQAHDLKDGLAQFESILQEIEAEKPIDLNMKSEVLYRIAYCKWHLNSSPASRKDKSAAYKYLIDCVKANPNYAPAYTLLGAYFHDYGKSKPRARVAFQKAFELSTSELIAAERLAKMFASNKEWDLVELVAKRVVNSGKAKPAPGSKKKALSWPYAALGVVEVNRQQYSLSIVSLQAALRISPNDYHSWVGLGESYHNSGRHVAALRAFMKAESIEHGLSDDQTWFAKYMLANVQKELGSFDEAIAAYQSVLTIKPDEYGILIAMLQTFAESAWAKIAQGMYGESRRLAKQAIVVAGRVIQQKANVFNMWKAVGDACSALGHTNYGSDEKFPEDLSNLLRDQVTDDLDPLSELDKTSFEFLTEKGPGKLPSVSDKCLIAALFAYKRAVHTSSHDLHAQAVAWYNLGWAEHRTYLSGGSSLKMTGQKPQRFLRAAMKCFKRAIELEASNSEFWNALGVVTMTANPRVAQHSFVRSLNLNEHSARAWTNLGALYLINNDNDLAYDAFIRAQSTDPEYPEAWVGQGLLCLLENKQKDARGFFLHAFEIADSSLLSTKRRYATSAFDHLIHADEPDVISFLQPLFATRQLHELSVANVTISHLMALYSEHVKDYQNASDLLVQVCEAVEDDYENSESNDDLARCAQAKADLARVQLALHDFEAAISNTETALDLSSEDDLGAAYSDIRQKWRLSARVTAGVAHSHLKHTDQSIKMLQAALLESPGSPDVTCLLAQVLWAKGGKAEKEAARSQLLDCVENNEGHVHATCLLAVIALSDEDEDMIEAVEDGLKELLIRDSVNDSEKMQAGRLVSALSEWKRMSDSSGNSRLTAIAAATSNVMLSPNKAPGWLELSQVDGANDEEEIAYAAEMAQKLASRQMPPGGSLEANDVAAVFATSANTEDTLQARILAPWRTYVDE